MPPIKTLSAPLPSLAAALGLVFAGAVPAMAQNLLVNGNFETGDFSSWEVVGDTSRSGISGEFSGVLPPEGRFQAHFGTTPGGQDVSIQQTVNGLRPGDRYQLTFSLANLGGAPNGFGVNYGSEFAYRRLNQGPFNYLRGLLIIIPMDGLINFRIGFDQPSSDWLIDDIVLVPYDAALPAVPEPSTWALMIAGFGLVGATARRQRLSGRNTVSG